MKREMSDATSAPIAEHELSTTADDTIASAPQQADTRYDSLKCNFCPMVFVDRADIERHLSSSHSNDGAPKRKKALVAKRVIKVAKAEEADESANSSSVHQCKVCLKVCLSFRGLTRHSAVHKNVVAKVELTCDYCEQTFASEEAKRSHVSDYHRILTGSDENDAGTGFMANSVCEVSVKVDDEKENVAAEEKKDEKKSTRRRTKKSEPGTAEEFVCEECGKAFEKKATYVRHKHTHNMSCEFLCDICQKGFSSEMMMKRHKSNAHRNKRGKSAEDDPFSKWYVFADGQKHLKCDQCKYNSLWYHKGRFLEHYRIHTGEKPFTCDLCGKQFRTKTLLQKHVMFVHEGIKEHPCDICGRCFSDKRYMEDHRRIHTGERPYVCDLCGKTFKQSASLFIHKELHKGLRKHGCEMCGKRFTTRSSLTIHIKRHIGERNFICATCGKAFVDGKHLKDHMAVHSEERPFSCELCGGKFKLMKHLKQHGRTHKRDYPT